jgi:abortive infection bacteriophage resistance protein
VLEALDAIEISVRAVITYEIEKDLGVFGHAAPANLATAFNHADFTK